MADPAETQRLYDMWIASIMTRVLASKQGSGEGPVGEQFLLSREFTHICDMLGIEPDYAREKLWPYAERKQPLRRREGYFKSWERNRNRGAAA